MKAARSGARPMLTPEMALRRSSRAFRPSGVSNGGCLSTGTGPRCRLLCPDRDGVPSTPGWASVVDLKPHLGSVSRESEIGSGQRLGSAALQLDLLVLRPGISCATTLPRRNRGASRSPRRMSAGPTDELRARVTARGQEPRSMVAQACSTARWSTQTRRTSFSSEGLT